MSLKILQFSPEGSTRVLRLIAIPEPWSASVAYSPEPGFLRAWFADDSGEHAVPRPLNWGAILGLALSLTISAGFWTGVGLFVAHFLR